MINRVSVYENFSDCTGTNPEEERDSTSKTSVTKSQTKRRNSSVSIHISLRAGRLDFLYCIWTISGPQSAFHQTGYHAYLPGDKVAKTEADHLPTYNAVVKNVWSCTSTVQRSV
jgi:hypothetical protein